VARLALDHHERDALVRHLGRVRVSELVGRAPPSDTCRRGRVVQLLAGG
jgi:hypothetical protein